MKRLNKRTLIIALFFVTNWLIAQTKQDLKTQKLSIEKDIKYTTELLKKTKFNKTKSLNYLNALETQIKNKKQLLIALNIETSVINKKIKKIELTVLEIEQEIILEKKNLKTLKEEYSKMIYAAFKQGSFSRSIIFILSSEDFNQAYKRILYLKQYSVFRKNQAKKIRESQKKLTKNKNDLVQQKNKIFAESVIKKDLVRLKKEELESINSVQNEKKALVKRLSESEKLFKNELQEKKKKAKKKR